MKIKLHINRLLLLIGVLFLFSCEQDIPDKFETEENLVSIVDYLYDNEEQYSYFIQIMEQTGMKDALAAYNPNGEKYTLFLPDNSAFELFFQESNEYSGVADLISDENYVNVLSRYHVVNRAITTNDFPLGALPDSTLSGDYLIIAYIQDADSTFFKVDNLAFVKQQNVEMTNGIIHIIDHVLKPITFSSYDWLKSNSSYSIFSDLMDVTGLKDTMDLYITGNDGKVKENQYSLLVEADSVFNKSGIFSVDELKFKYSPKSNDYTDDQNSLYQFAAYHILEKSIFLADLVEGSSNYNTYASLPLQIQTGIDIKVNVGVEKFDSIFNAIDSSYSYIDYLNIYVNESNVQTRTGAIHFVNRVMELFKPSQARRDFAFYEEPMIEEVRGNDREYIFTRPEHFTVFKWAGVENLIYNGTEKKAWGKDYIQVDGNFTLTYKIPKMLAGKYGVQLRVDAGKKENATIQLYVDGKKVGPNLNLTSGGSNSSPFRLKNMGIIEFNKYEEHTIVVRTLIPGRFAWDIIRFESNLKEYDSNNQ